MKSDNFERVRARARQTVHPRRFTKAGCAVRSTTYHAPDGEVVLEDVTLEVS